MASTEVEDGGNSGKDEAGGRIGRQDGGDEGMEKSQRKLLDENSILADVKSKPSRSHLYLSAFILNAVYLIIGTAFAWSSPVLEKLKLETSAGSSVASLLALGCVFGPILSGIVLDPLGRRGTVALSMALMTGSYVLLTLASSVFQLSVGRFIAGLACGIVFSAVPLYIAEISENEVRGLLNTLSQLALCLGNLIMYSMGPFVSYSTLHYSMLGLCCLFFLMFPLLPQSPYTLVMKKDVEAARQTLARLRRGRSVADVEKEVQLVQETIKQNRADKASFTDLFTVPGNRKALILCCMLLILQQVSGIMIILFYAQEIFRLTGTTIESSTCSIIIGLIMTSTAFFCPIAVGYLGYKKPLLGSAAGMALGVGGLGVFFMLKDNGFEVNSISLMPLLSIVIYVISFNSGFCNIPWALSGELFPSNIKPIATTFVASTCGLATFFLTNLFGDLIDLIGLQFLFMACSFFCFISIVFVTLVVQDTNGLSFAEIQQILNGKKRKDILRDRVMSDLKEIKL